MIGVPTGCRINPTYRVGVRRGLAAAMAAGVLIQATPPGGFRSGGSIRPRRTAVDLHLRSGEYLQAPAVGEPEDGEIRVDRQYLLDPGVLGRPHE